MTKDYSPLLPNDGAWHTGRISSVSETSLASCLSFRSRGGRISVSMSSSKRHEQSKNIWGALSFSQGTLQMLKMCWEDSRLPKVKLLDNKPPFVRRRKEFKPTLLGSLLCPRVAFLSMGKKKGADLSQRAYNVLSSSTAKWPRVTWHCLCPRG